MVAKQNDFGPENLSLRKRLKPVKMDLSANRVYFGPENLSLRKRLKPIKRALDVDKIYFGPENLSLRKRLKPVKRNLNVHIDNIYHGAENLSLRKRLKPLRSLLVTPEVTKTKSPLSAVGLESDKDATQLEPRYKTTAAIVLQKPGNLNKMLTPKKSVKIVSLKAPEEQVNLLEFGPENLSFRKRLKPVKRNLNVDDIYRGAENLSLRKRLKPLETLLVTPEVPKTKSHLTAIVLESGKDETKLVPAKFKTTAAIVLQKPENLNKMSKSEQSVKVISLKAPTEQIQLREISSKPKPPSVAVILESDKGATKLNPKFKTSTAIVLQPSKNVNKMSPGKPIEIVSLKAPTEQVQVRDLSAEELSLRKKRNHALWDPVIERIYFGPENLSARKRPKPLETVIVTPAISQTKSPSVAVVFESGKDATKLEPKFKTTASIVLQPSENFNKISPEKSGKIVYWKAPAKQVQLQKRSIPVTKDPSRRSIYFGPKNRTSLRKGLKTSEVADKERLSLRNSRLLFDSKRRINVPNQFGPNREPRAGVKPATHFGPGIQFVHGKRKN